MGAPGGSGGDGAGGEGAGPGGGTGLCVLLPPSQVFQVPSGLTQYGPGDGAPSHSQQLLVWWPGEKFHVEQLPALQHAASHAAAVRLGSRCMFLHCSPARLCGKLQFLVKSRAVATTVQGQDANNSSGIAIGRAICAVPAPGRARTHSRAHAFL